MRAMTLSDKIRFALIWTLILLLLTPSEMFAAQPSQDSQLAITQIELTEDEVEFFQAFSQIKMWIQEFSPRDVSVDQLYRGALAGMVQALGDPYSQYLTKEQYEKLTSTLDGEYVGIGVTIDLVDEQITVINTFKDSPAERAGIKAGDIITSVDGNDLQGKLPVDAQSLLRGQAGTVVTMKFLRPSDNSTFVVELIRSLIKQDYVEVKDIGDGIWYIRITQFTQDAAKSFEAILGYLHLKEIDGLVLDLRDNPGGLLDACIGIASRLIPKGPIVELRRKELVESIENQTDPAAVLPIVVLVNGGSASASEILAGAIRDRGVGILVGEKTFGKACVQVIAGLDESSGLRLTIADYYTPSGFSLAETGLTPDIIVKPEELVTPSTFQYKRPIVAEMVGLDVLALQESLSFLGYNIGEPDGVLGNKTLTGVRTFLGDHGLTWQGSFGESEASQLSAAIVECVLNRPDTVLETGVDALRSKLESGQWPVPTQPATQ